jgi:hypothetical protein
MQTTLFTQNDQSLSGDSWAAGVPLWAPPLAATLLALIVTAYFLQTRVALTGGRWGAPLDDAWIHYPFARNLSQGFGFSYNPGEPMPESTSPLWTLLLAGVGLFTHDFLRPTLLLSAASLAAAVWLTYGLAYWLTQNVVEPPAQFVADAKTIIGEQEGVVYQAHWPYLSQAAAFNHEAKFGQAIRLVGYDLGAPPGTPEPLALTLYWQSLAPVAVGYDVFIHVLGDEGQIVTQADSEPVSILAPTHRWQPGDFVRDRRLLFLPPEATGAYRIQVSLFDRSTGTRLAAEADQVLDDAVYLTSFDWNQDAKQP